MVLPLLLSIRDSKGRAIPKSGDFVRICLVQHKPSPGQLSINLEHHKKIIEQLSQLKPDLIVFSELSLTGYEPSRSEKLALQPNAKDLDIFQELSDALQATIAVGLPLRSMEGIQIGLALFQPNSPRILGAKNYLHADEDPFFIRGENLPVTKIKGEKIVFAICYELSVPEHALGASKSSANLYIASVAKTNRGVESAYQRLSQVAQDFSMTTLMVNAIGPADDFLCAGQSAIWNTKGQLLDSLEHDDSGVLILDTETEKTQRLALNHS